MNTRILPTACDLSLAGVNAALKILNETDASSLLQRVEFVTLEIDPDQWDMSLEVAHHLLKTGLGIRLRPTKQFRGSGKWAVFTDRTRVVSW